MKSQPRSTGPPASLREALRAGVQEFQSGGTGSMKAGPEIASPVDCVTSARDFADSKRARTRGLREERNRTLCAVAPELL